MRRGFTLIEILIVVAIIVILASIVLVAVNDARHKGGDARRKIEVSQFGRLATASCYVPNAGPGEYDLAVLASELRAKYPQYANIAASLPHDPSTGNDSVTNYRYIVNGTGQCALYANLENTKESVTIPSINAPSPGGGTGVFQGSVGWNGSDKYFQVSN